MNERWILSRKTLSACWDLLIWDFKRQFSPKIWVFFPLANGTLSWGSRWSEWVRNDLTGNIWLNHCLFWHVAGHLGLYRSKFGLEMTKLQLFLSPTLTHPILPDRGLCRGPSWAQITSKTWFDTMWTEEKHLASHLGLWQRPRSGRIGIDWGGSRFGTKRAVTLSF